VILLNNRLSRYFLRSSSSQKYPFLQFRRLLYDKKLQPAIIAISMKYQILKRYRKLLFVVMVVVPVKGQEPGIAAAYPGDADIEKDSAVVFTENFEEPSIAAVVSRWTSSTNDSGMTLSADVPSASSGKHSLLVTSINGVNTGGRLYKRFYPGLSRLYLRYYIKFAPKPGYYHHTGGRLSGCSEPSGTCGGHAGEPPQGNYAFTTGVEPNYEYDQPSTGLRLDFYTYWMGMRQGTSGNYYGNTFIHDPTVKAEYEQWASIEIMIKVNDPVASSNGEQAFWLNGKKIVHLGPGFPKGVWIGGNDFMPESTGISFDGFQWRSIDSLKINLMKIEHYVEEGEETQGYPGKCRFDDIVCATKYIGPISPTTRAFPIYRAPHALRSPKPNVQKTIGCGISPKITIAKQAINGRTEYYSVSGNKINPTAMKDNRRK
jgi:hypothetical protein